MQTNSDLQTQLGTMVSLEHFTSVNMELHDTKAELKKLFEENRSLKLRSLELKAQVELETGRRSDIEEKVNKLMNSPGAVSDQLRMWSDQVNVLEQITDLQSSLIDKDFIIKQSEVIRDLKGVLDLASPERSEAVDTESASSIFSVEESEVIKDLQSDLDRASPERSEADEVESVTSVITVDEIQSSTAEDSIPDNSAGNVDRRRPKFKKGNTYLVYNSTIHQPAATTDNIADLHTNDRERLQRFHSVLDRLESLPEHVDSLLLMDSNGHKIKGRQLDPVNGSTWVLSSGGLCVIAAVHALQLHDKSYGNIQKVTYSLGTNDHLHRTQHVLGERVSYLKALREVTAKLFPNASMHFILPFNGGKVPKSSIDSLHTDIATHIPECVVHYPPNMRAKFSDGVHLNHEGIARFTAFLREDLVPRRQTLFSRSSGRRSAATTYSSSLNPPGRVNTLSDPSSRMWEPRDSGNSNHWGPASPVCQSSHQLQIDRNLVSEVAAEVINELMSRNLLNNV